MADLPPPDHLEGRSFAPLLADPEAIVHDAVFSEMQRGPRLGLTIRTERYRYVEWTGPQGAVLARELYDEVRDPQENENLAVGPEGKSVGEELSRILNARLPLPR